LPEHSCRGVFSLNDEQGRRKQRECRPWAAGAPIVPPLSIDQNRYTGWFLGSGYEYRFDWLPGLYWKTEYRFSSFSSKDSQLLQGGIPVTGEFVHSEKFIQTVTSSLVWRFNWWR
jgi:outer membrane immunogenic protein